MFLVVGVYGPDRYIMYREGSHELLSQRGQLEAYPTRKPTPTAKSLTQGGKAEYLPMQMRQSTGTFNMLDVARKVISVLLHKHQLII